MGFPAILRVQYCKYPIMVCEYFMPASFEKRSSSAWRVTPPFPDSMLVFTLSRDSLLFLDTLPDYSTQALLPPPGGKLINFFSYGILARPSILAIFPCYQRFLWAQPSHLSTCRLFLLPFVIIDAKGYETHRVHSSW